MKTLFQSASVLVADLASTFIFLAVLLLSPHFPPAIRANAVPIGIVAGIVFGISQIAWEYARKKPVGAIQWVSLFLVIAFGGASLITHDPRFIMVKPSLIYVIVGVVMLKPGWINRYSAAGSADVRARSRRRVRLRLGRAHVPFRRAESWCGRTAPERDRLGVLHVDLRDRLQGEPVPDPVQRHAVHRRPPPPRTRGDGARAGAEAVAA